LYNLLDEQMEFQLTDRLSFRRFVGLEVSHKVPDCNTIWNFKEKLKIENNTAKPVWQFIVVELGIFYRVRILPATITSFGASGDIPVAATYKIPTCP
jgi:IS5 family transposase